MSGEAREWATLGACEGACSVAWEGDGYHVSEDVSGRKSWKFGNRIIGGKD